MSKARFSGATRAALFITFIFSGFLGFQSVSVADAATPSTDPAVVGKWSNNKPWPVKAVHVSLLPDGKVMMWPSNEGDNPYIWNPNNNGIKRLEQAGYNLFCAGFSLMADGKLFVAGGHIVTPFGLPAASIFDHETNTWTRLADMNAGRWYPTVTQLSDGNVLVTSGNTETGVVNTIPQVYDIKTGAWRTLIGANIKTSLYPFMFEIGKGQVFMAGSRGDTRYLNTQGAGSWSSAIDTNYGSRSSGTSVMYDEGKILILGGGLTYNGPSTNTAEIIDLNSSTPRWTYTASMREPRKHANATLLPTSKVLVTGGSKALNGDSDDETSPVYMAEMWNPKTGTWTKLASNSVYRGYHSMALLLPDGRVLVAGGEKIANSYEIYSPPYLFKGTRPEIYYAPEQVEYGDTFPVETSQINSITEIRWIRMGSVTHSFNQGQRINELKFEKVRKDGKTVKLKVAAPSDRGMTPPGYYMLFVLNDKGVPSVAKIIKVGNISVPLKTLTPAEQSKLSPIPMYDEKAKGIEDHAAHGNFE